MVYMYVYMVVSESNIRPSLPIPQRVVLRVVFFFLVGGGGKGTKRVKLPAGEEENAEGW